MSSAQMNLGVGAMTVTIHPRPAGNGVCLRVEVAAEDLMKPIVVQRVIGREADPWLLLHDVRLALEARGRRVEEVQTVCAWLWGRLVEEGVLEKDGWLPILSLGEAVRFGELSEPADDSGFRIASNGHLLDRALQGWERELLAPVATKLVVKLVEESVEESDGAA